MDDLLEPFARLLDDVAAVRAWEAGAPCDDAWAAITDSGFLDALVAEAQGGAGLTLAQIEPLVRAIGARALPLPIAETMVARALLADAGVAAPAGPIVLASGAWPVPGALLASHAIVAGTEGLRLVALDGQREPTGVHGSLAARIAADAPGVALPPAPLRAMAAVLRAGLIAGAAERLTELSADYANTRVQFGKPIGRQQALQQMLSVMAEDMIATRIAAQLGMAAWPDVAIPAAATAKITASAAAARLAASAHAVHGAIGIAEEHDLNLLTRAIHAWRLADGSEGYWSAQLGAARLGSNQASVDWLRGEVFA